MKRIVLFLVTNIAVMLVLGVAAHLLGVNRYLTAGGLNLTALLGFCALFGFGGSFISLWMSKPIAKWSTGARTITGDEGSDQAWLVSTVRALADKAGIAMPEVAYYEGEPNAFATGATKNSSLVAVSTGLLRTMDRRQVEAVLAHEVAHIANGDMVTLTLIQGVVNTFVMFAARVVGYFVDQFLFKKDEDDTSVGIGYTVTVVVLDIVFGILASIVVAAFSRQREYRADAGAAALLGQPHSMISALQVLGSRDAGELPKGMAAFGISGKAAMSLFASHPPIEERIEALKRLG